MGNVRGALEVARSARTILGANGVTLEYPVIRHVNNLESVLTYEGTHEVHTLVVGQALTGENAFRLATLSRSASARRRGTGRGRPARHECSFAGRGCIETNRQVSSSGTRITRSSAP